MSGLQYRLIQTAKTMFYARCGEPFRIGATTLRFVPGTRPIRLRYRNSDNSINRYDALQLAWMIDNLCEGDIAIDVGANCGQCTIVMAEKCGLSGTVIAFEPNPRARALLERNFDLNPTIKCAKIEAFACSDVSGGEAELYQNDSPANSALVALPGNLAASMKRESFRAAVTTLDAYLGQSGLPTPRFVKIDTEGAEIRILQGAPNLLMSEAAILCELHPYAWPYFGNSLQELNDLLARYRRSMRYLDQDRTVASEAIYGIVVLERV